MLVQRVAQGDEAAYSLLVARHLPALGRYVVRMMANHADADDVVQDTFIRFWTNATKFDPQQSRLTTWLHNIAHNLCIDYFRKHNRLVGEVDDEQSVRGPEVDSEQRETARKIDQLMMQLPERQRSAIIMCHYQGMSNKEVADVLDISVRALESLLVRGRNSLRKGLNHES